MQPAPESISTLDKFILEVNDELEKAGTASANQAFNVGCSVGLLPVIVIVLLAFFISGNSWIATAITAGLMLLAWIGFANLVAQISKSKSITRTYKDYLAERITRELRELNISQSQFNQTALEILPKGAALRSFLPLPVAIATPS